MFENSNFWSAVSAVVGVAVAIATWMTYWVIRRYTDETQKLRKAAQNQVEITERQAAVNEQQLLKMTEQYDLSSRIAASQTVLTFSFRQCVSEKPQEYPQTAAAYSPDYSVDRSKPLYWMYPLVVVGKGFQNLAIEAVPPSEKQRFELIDFRNHEAKFWNAVNGEDITHVLMVLAGENLSRASGESFRLTYVDALRYRRWDEFNFRPNGPDVWQPVWLKSGYTVTSDLTMNDNIENRA